MWSTALRPDLIDAFSLNLFPSWQHCREAELIRGVSALGSLRGNVQEGTKRGVTMAWRRRDEL